METFKNPTTKTPKKSWQVLSAIFAFALYLIGVISSFITLSYDWSTGFIFIVLFFMGFVYVGISMLVAIVRDVYFQFKYILYIGLNIVAMTTFIAMVLYLWWGVSPKRMKVNKQ